MAHTLSFECPLLPLRYKTITHSSPGVNSETVGPIGYLGATMSHGGNLLSLEQALISQQQ